MRQFLIVLGVAAALTAVACGGGGTAVTRGSWGSAALVWPQATGGVYMAEYQDNTLQTAVSVLGQLAATWLQWLGAFIQPVVDLLPVSRYIVVGRPVPTLREAVGVIHAGRATAPSSIADGWWCPADTLVAWDSAGLPTGVTQIGGDAGFAAVAAVVRPALAGASYRR